MILGPDLNYKKLSCKNCGYPLSEYHDFFYLIRMGLNSYKYLVTKRYDFDDFAVVT